MTNGSGYRQQRSLAMLTVGALLLAGCQQKMAQQPSYKPLDASSFFPDGRSARPLVPGTVARGHLRVNQALYTGRRGSARNAATRAADAVAAGAAGPLQAVLASTAGEGAFVDQFPFPITEEIVRHGQNRYMIYCVVCHDSLGTGRGKIVERGYTAPPSYHIERLRKAPVGRFFAVITEGYGSMPSYAAPVPPRDRWAITAYIRALQLSQHFPAERLPADLRQELDQANHATTTGGNSP